MRTLTVDSPTGGVSRHSVATMKLFFATSHIAAIELPIRDGSYIVCLPMSSELTMTINDPSAKRSARHIASRLTTS